MKAHKLQPEFDAIRRAKTAAHEATSKMLTANPEQWYPCGFAWVRIRPARGPLVQALKDAGIGRVSEEGGYMVYNPSENPTQWMDAKEAGARAFVNELVMFLLTKPATYTQYKIRLETRMD